MIEERKDPELLHIVIVTHSYPRFKGDWRSNFIEELAVGYRQCGAEVTVLVPYVREWNRESEDNAGISIVTYRYVPFASWHILGYGKSMKGDLKMNPLHVLLFPCLLVFGSFRLARLLRSRRVSFIHAHWAVPNTLIALAGRVLARAKVKVFSSFPGSDVTVITRSGVLGNVLARIIGRSDYLACNSFDLKEDLVKAGMPAERIDLVIYGVNNATMRFDQRARQRIRGRLGLAKGDVMLLMVGRFVPKKGFTTAIRAMRLIKTRFNKTRLFVIGSGLLESEYKRIIADDNTDDVVTLLGEVLLGDLADYYAACDVLLMPSERYPTDGLNVVVVEAMACGRPVVASDVGGNDLVVFDGVNGYLHRAGDAAELVDKLIPLIESNSLRQTMGEASKRLVDDRFNWQSIAQRYISEYYPRISS